MDERHRAVPSSSVHAASSLQDPLPEMSWAAVTDVAKRKQLLMPGVHLMHVRTKTLPMQLRAYMGENQAKERKGASAAILANM